MRKAAARATVLALIATTILAAPAAATAGWLDPTFSADGYRRVDPGVDTPSSVGSPAIDGGPTGRIFLARYVIFNEQSSVGFRALTSSGAIDTAFGGGEWLGEIGSLDPQGPKALVPTSNGGVLGASWEGFDRSLTVRRLGPGGGITHSRALDTNLDNMTNGVGLPDGSVRWCGDPASALPPSELIALTSTLEPVASASGQPLEIPDCNSIASDVAHHLYVSTDRIKDPITGDTRRLFEVLRTSTDGETDATWGAAGHAVIERSGLHLSTARAFQSGRAQFSPVSPVIFPLPDGSILVAGRIARIDPAGPGYAAVLKVTPAGTLDPAFGTGGIKAMGPTDGQSRIIAMTVDGAGRPIISVVYNYNDGRTRAFLARLTTDGHFDPGFGRKGLVQQTHGATAMSLDADGRLLTVAMDGEWLVVARRTN